MGLLDVILGYDCNLACDYCTITPAMRRRALGTAAVLQALRRGRDLGYASVSFTGGEPTIRRDLIGLVRAARRLGFVDVKVQTNGLVFAEMSNVDRMLAAGATRFHMSIHTHDADRYDALVRREGAYPLMVAALDNFVARNAMLTADVIMKEDTYRQLPDAIQWLHDRGVRRADLWFVSLTDHNRDNIDSMPRKIEVVPYLRAACDLGEARGMTIRSLHVPRCLLGVDHVRFAFDPGAERVRVVTPDAELDLRDSKLTGQIHVPACRGCEWEGVCPGVRADYLERYGDAEIARARNQRATIPPTRLPIVST